MSMRLSTLEKWSNALRGGIFGALYVAAKDSSSGKTTTHVMLVVAAVQMCLFPLSSLQEELKRAGTASTASSTVTSILSIFNASSLNSLIGPMLYTVVFSFALMWMLMFTLLTAAIGRKFHTGAPQSVFIKRHLLCDDVGARTDGRADVRLLGMKIALMVAYATLRGQALWFKVVLLLLAGALWLHSFIRVQPFVNPRMNELQAGLGGAYCLAVVALLLALYSPQPLLVVSWCILLPVATFAGGLAARAWRHHIAALPLQDLTASVDAMLWARTRLFMMHTMMRTNRSNIDALMGDVVGVGSGGTSGGDDAASTAGGIPSASGRVTTAPTVDALLIAMAGQGASLDSILSPAQRDQLTQELRDAAEFAFRWCIARFPDNGMVHMAAADFYRSSDSSRYLELTALSMARKATNALDVQFFVYQRNRQLRESTKEDGGGPRSGNITSQVDRLMMEQHGALALKAETSIRQQAVRMWEELAAPVPDLAALAKLGRKLHKAIGDAEENYSTQLRMQRQNVNVLRQYGAFMITVLGKMVKGSEMIAKAERLEETMAGRFSRHVAKFVLMDETRQVSMGVESTAVVHASGDPSNLGEITLVNSRAAALFRRSPVDMVGTPLYELLPEPLDRLLENMLLEHVRRGNQHVLRNTRLTVVEDSFHQLWPVRFTLKEAPPEEDEITANFVCVFQDVTIDNDFMLCGLASDGLSVLSASASAYRMLNVETSQDGPADVDLDEVLPELASVVQAALEQPRRDFSWKRLKATVGDTVAPMVFPGGEKMSVHVQLLALPDAVAAGASLSGAVALVMWQPFSKKPSRRLDRSMTSTANSSSRSLHSLASPQPVPPQKVRAASRLEVRVPHPVPESAETGASNPDGMRVPEVDAMSAADSIDTAALDELVVSPAAAHPTPAEERVSPVEEGTELPPPLDSEPLIMEDGGVGTLEAGEQGGSAEPEEGEEAGLERRFTRAHSRSAGQLLPASEPTEDKTLPRHASMPSLKKKAKSFVKREDPPRSILRADGKPQAAPSTNKDAKRGARALPADARPKSTVLAMVKSPGSVASAISGFGDGASEAGNTFGPGGGSVASSTTSSNSATAPRTVLLSLIRRTGYTEASIRGIKGGLRAALVFAVLLGITQLVGLDIIKEQTALRVQSLTHAGQVLRTIQGATVSAAMLNLHSLGAPIGTVDEIKASLAREASTVRDRWREVVSDSEQIDTHAERLKAGGLKSTVDVYDVGDTRGTMTLYAAMGNAIANLDSLVKSNASAFNMENPSFTYTVRNVPLVLVDSLNATIALRQFQTASFMFDIQLLILVTAIVATSVLGLGLGLYLSAMVSKISTSRQQALAVLLALPKPALSKLKRFAKARLVEFKESTAKESTAAAEAVMDEDAAADKEAGAGKDEGGVAKVSVPTSGDSVASSTDSRAMRMVAANRTISKWHLSAQRIGERDVVDTSHFSLVHLGILMLQVALTITWLGGTMGNLLISQRSTLQDIRRLYATQQVSSQVMKVNQASSLAVTLPRGPARAAALEQLGTALDMSLVRLTTLLQGSAAQDGLQEVDGLKVNGPAFQIFYENSCEGIEKHYLLPPNCTTFDGGVMKLGMQIVLQRYLQRGRGVAAALRNITSDRIAEEIGAALSNRTLSSTSSGVENREEDLMVLFTRLRDMVTMEDPYIRYGMRSLDNIFDDATRTTAKSSQEANVLMNVAFLILSLALHLAVHLPHLEEMQAQLDGTRSLLLSVPTQYLNKDKRAMKVFREFVINLTMKARGEG